MTRRNTRKQRPGFWASKTTGELLVLIVALTVCTYVAVVTLLIVILAFTTDRDLKQVAANIGDIINTLIGLLAGFLAGRTDRNSGSKPPEE